jgi:hypothetical protein
MTKRSEPWSAPSPPSREQLARTNRLRLAVGERAEVLEEAARKTIATREHGTPSGIKTGQGSGSGSDGNLYGKSSRKGQTEEAIQIGGSPTLQVFTMERHTVRGCSRERATEASRLIENPAGAERRRAIRLHRSVRHETAIPSIPGIS